MQTQRCYCGCGEPVAEGKRFIHGHNARGSSWARIPHRDGTKYCHQCDSWKPLSDFNRDQSRWDGLNHQCRSCNLVKNAQWRARNPAKSKEQYRRKWIKSNYGLTAEEYDALLGQGCAICGSFEHLGADHDHANGKVRAALCRDCNLGIGRFGDDPDRMRRASQYITDWQKEHGNRPVGQ